MIQIPLTPQEFASTATLLEQKQGIVLSGPTGQITRMGVTATYAYAAGLLTIDITEKPFFVTTEYCEEQLRSFLAKP